MNDTDTITEPTNDELQDRPAFVKVAVLSGDTVPLDYRSGMTVQQALDEAGAQVSEGQLVTVNGLPATADQVLEPNSALVVAGKTSNG